MLKWAVAKDGEGGRLKGSRKKGEKSSSEILNLNINCGKDNSPSVSPQSSTTDNNNKKSKRRKLSHSSSSKNSNSNSNSNTSPPDHTFDVDVIKDNEVNLKNSARSSNTTTSSTKGNKKGNVGGKFAKLLNRHMNLNLNLNNNNNSSNNNTCHQKKPSVKSPYNFDCDSYCESKSLLYMRLDHLPLAIVKQYERLITTENDLNEENDQESEQKSIFSPPIVLNRGGRYCYVNGQNSKGTTNGQSNGRTIRDSPIVGRKINISSSTSSSTTSTSTSSSQPSILFSNSNSTTTTTSTATTSPNSAKNFIKVATNRPIKVLSSPKSKKHVVNLNGGSGDKKTASFHSETTKPQTVRLRQKMPLPSYCEPATTATTNLKTEIETTNELGNKVNGVPIPVQVNCTGDGREKKVGQMSHKNVASSTSTSNSRRPFKCLNNTANNDGDKSANNFVKPLLPLPIPPTTLPRTVQNHDLTDPEFLEKSVRISYPAMTRCARKFTLKRGELRKLERLRSQTERLNRILQKYYKGFELPQVEEGDETDDGLCVVDKSVPVLRNHWIEERFPNIELIRRRVKEQIQPSSILMALSSSTSSTTSDSDDFETTSDSYKPQLKSCNYKSNGLRRNFMNDQASLLPIIAEDTESNSNSSNADHDQDQDNYHTSSLNGYYFPDITKLQLDQNNFQLDNSQSKGCLEHQRISWDEIKDQDTADLQNHSIKNQNQNIESNGKGVLLLGKLKGLSGISQSQGLFVEMPTKNLPCEDFLQPSPPIPPPSSSTSSMSIASCDSSPKTPCKNPNKSQNNTITTTPPNEKPSSTCSNRVYNNNKGEIPIGLVVQPENSNSKVNFEKNPPMCIYTIEDPNETWNSHEYPDSDGNSNGNPEEMVRKSDVSNNQVIPTITSTPMGSSSTSRRFKKSKTTPRKILSRKTPVKSIFSGNGELLIRSYRTDDGPFITIHVIQAKNLPCSYRSSWKLAVKISLSSEPEKTYTNQTFQVPINKSSIKINLKCSYEILNKLENQKLFITCWKKLDYQKVSTCLGWTALDLNKNSQSWLKLRKMSISSSNTNGPITPVRRSKKKPPLISPNTSTVPEDHDVHNNNNSISSIRNSTEFEIHRRRSLPPPLPTSEPPQLTPEEEFRTNLMINSSTMDSGVEDCDAPPPHNLPCLDMDDRLGHRVHVHMDKLAEGGFGFSVVWVQPPRIERVDASGIAFNAGLRIGDLIIGVNGVNILSLENTTIFQKMKTTGNALDLELWRRYSSPSSEPSPGQAQPNQNSNNKNNKNNKNNNLTTTPISSVSPAVSSSTNTTSTTVVANVNVTGNKNKPLLPSQTPTAQPPVPLLSTFVNVNSMNNKNAQKTTGQNTIGKTTVPLLATNNNNNTNNSFSNNNHPDDDPLIDEDPVDPVAEAERAKLLRALPASVKAVFGAGTQNKPISILKPAPTVKAPPSQQPINSNSRPPPPAAAPAPQSSSASWKIRFNVELLDNEDDLLKQFFLCELKYFRKVVAALDRYLIPAQANSLLTPQEIHLIFAQIITIIIMTKRILQCVANGASTKNSSGFKDCLHSTHADHLTEMSAAYMHYGRTLGDSASLLSEKMGLQIFAKFAVETPVPKGHLDLTSLLFAPLEHLRNLCEICEEISHNMESWNDFGTRLKECYADIVCETDYMEPITHISMKKHPLLSVRDLEKRLVSTNFQAIKVIEKGRKWLFGSRLFKKESDGSWTPVWAFLFTDIIILTSHTTRDRVFFVKETPLRLEDVGTIHFNLPKKHENEFRLLFGPEPPQPNSRFEKILPIYRKQKANQVILHAPNPKVKSLWKLLLQRQIITLNTRLTKSSSSCFSISEFCEKFPIEESPVEEDDKPIVKDTTEMKNKNSKNSKLHQTNQGNIANNNLQVQAQSQGQNQNQSQSQTQVKPPTTSKNLSKSSIPPTVIPSVVTAATPQSQLKCEKISEKIPEKIEQSAGPQSPPPQPQQRVPEQIVSKSNEIVSTKSISTTAGGNSSITNTLTSVELTKMTKAKNVVPDHPKVNEKIKENLSKKSNESNVKHQPQLIPNVPEKEQEMKLANLNASIYVPAPEKPHRALTKESPISQSFDEKQLVKNSNNNLTTISSVGSTPSKSTSNTLSKNKNLLTASTGTGISSSSSPSTSTASVEKAPSVKSLAPGVGKMDPFGASSIGNITSALLHGQQPTAKEMEPPKKGKKDAGKSGVKDGGKKEKDLKSQSNTSINTTASATGVGKGSANLKKVETPKKKVPLPSTTPSTPIVDDKNKCQNNNEKKSELSNVGNQVTKLNNKCNSNNGPINNNNSIVQVQNPNQNPNRNLEKVGESLSNSKETPKKSTIEVNSNSNLNSKPQSQRQDDIDGKVMDSHIHGKVEEKLKNESISMISKPMVKPLTPLLLHGYKRGVEEAAAALERGSPIKYNHLTSLNLELERKRNALIVNTTPPRLETSSEKSRRRVLYDQMVHKDYPELFGITPRDRRSFIKQLGENNEGDKKSLTAPYYYTTASPIPTPRRIYTETIANNGNGDTDNIPIHQRRQYLQQNLDGSGGGKIMIENESFLVQQEQQSSRYKNDFEEELTDHSFIQHEVQIHETQVRHRSPEDSSNDSGISDEMNDRTRNFDDKYDNLNEPVIPRCSSITKQRSYEKAINGKNIMPPEIRPPCTTVSAIRNPSTVTTTSAINAPTNTPNTTTTTVNGNGNINVMLGQSPPKRPPRSTDGQQRKPQVTMRNETIQVSLSPPPPVVPIPAMNEAKVDKSCGTDDDMQFNWSELYKGMPETSLRDLLAQKREAFIIGGGVGGEAAKNHYYYHGYSGGSPSRSIISNSSNSYSNTVSNSNGGDPLMVKIVPGPGHGTTIQSGEKDKNNINHGNSKILLNPSERVLYTRLEKEQKCAKIERIESSDESTSSDAASAENGGGNENGTTDPSWSSSSSSLAGYSGSREELPVASTSTSTSTGSILPLPSIYPRSSTLVNGYGKHFHQQQQNVQIQPEIVVTKESPVPFIRHLSSSSTGTIIENFKNNDQNQDRDNSHDHEFMRVESNDSTVENIGDEDDYNFDDEDEDEISHNSSLNMNRYGTYESLEKIPGEGDLSDFPPEFRSSIPRSKARFTFEDDDDDEEDLFEEDFESDFNFRFPSQIQDNTYNVSRLGPLPPLLEEEIEDDEHWASTPNGENGESLIDHQGFPNGNSTTMSSSSRYHHRHQESILKGENSFLLARLATMYARSSISPLKILRELWLKKRYRQWDTNPKIFENEPQPPENLNSNPKPPE